MTVLTRQGNWAWKLPGSIKYIYYNKDNTNPKGKGIKGAKLEPGQKSTFDNPELKLD